MLEGENWQAHLYAFQLMGDTLAKPAFFAILIIVKSFLNGLYHHRTHARNELLVFYSNHGLNLGYTVWRSHHEIKKYAF
jgi:hypothetical protein